MEPSSRTPEGQPNRCPVCGKSLRIEVILNGLQVLRYNPWDIPALRAMGTASEKMGDGELEIAYLKTALECDPKDPNVDRQLAAALARQQNEDVGGPGE